jgi:hypothetical protein
MNYSLIIYQPFGGVEEKIKKLNSDEVPSKTER